MTEAVCVQCGSYYDEKENSVCAFHLSPNSSRSGSFDCCGASEPCQTAPSHRSKHHNDYPYAAFFNFVSSIRNYTDTWDVYHAEMLTNMNDYSEEKASVGKLLRFKSRSDILEEDLLVVHVGTVWYGNKYFFEIFSVRDLERIGKEGKTLIFCNSDRADQHSKAEWIIEDGEVKGVVLTVKVASSESSSITEVRFSQKPLALIEKKVLQRGGLDEHPPTSPLSLPEETSNVSGGAPDLLTVFKRPARTDFFTFDKVTKKRELEIEVNSIAPNNRRISGVDTFVFKLVLLNSGQQTHLFSRFRFEYKMLNGETWFELPTDSIDLNARPLPFTLGALGTIEISGEARVPHYFGDNDARIDRKDIIPVNTISEIAKYKPVRFRFTLITPKGGEVSKVAEYVQPTPRLRVKESQKGLFIFVDSVVSMRRFGFTLEPVDVSTGYLTGNMLCLSVEKARKAVFEALKSGKTEYPLTDLGTHDEEYDIDYFALIDPACKVVYALKIQLKENKQSIAKQAYFPIPYYGPTDVEPVDPVPAVEEATLPEVTDTVIPLDLLFDDKDECIDDLTEADLQFFVDDNADGEESSSKEGTGGGVTSVDLGNVQKELDKVNENLGRIATAFESLFNMKMQKEKGK